MREKSNMELQIQKKMEQFWIEPDPADWQAIYDRLHKKKRRRFIWWILPISGVLLLGGGAYFVSREERSSYNDSVVKEKIEKCSKIVY